MPVVHRSKAGSRTTWKAASGMAADPDRVYPFGMPSVGYTRGEERLSIDWAVHGQAGGSSGAADEWVDVRGDRAALEALAGQVPDGSYGLLVSMTRDYFSE